jgi:carbonic anhydrase/acetyltransferase-like protein (isoleucine patch superfamily)
MPAMETLFEYDGKRPQVAADALVAAGARLIGDVRVGEASSIWFNCVLRGDIQRVVIGHHTNIQDNAVCHVDYGKPCVVGNYVTVGHGAILHGCEIGDEVLVGMGAVVMSGVTVGAQSIIGAGALLTEGRQVPAGSLVYGAPAKVISHLGQKERAELKRWAEEYCRLAESYRPR